jgi:hypothetical protein
MPRHQEASRVAGGDLDGCHVRPMLAADPDSEWQHFRAVPAAVFESLELLTDPCELSTALALATQECQLV